MAGRAEYRPAGVRGERSAGLPRGSRLGFIISWERAGAAAPRTPRQSAIQRAASNRGRGLSLHWCTRPRFRRESNAACSSTWRCLEIAGAETRKGLASSPTEASPRDSLARMLRRIGSARAENVASIEAGICLTIMLNLWRAVCEC